MVRSISALFFCVLLWSSSIAQNVPLGHWQTHLPYKNAFGLAVSKENVYCAAEYAVFSYRFSDGSIKKYSKSEGLSDIGVSAIGYDTSSNTLIIAYTNANIDILQNGKVTNLPFLKDDLNFGDKAIRNIHVIPGKAFLSTGFGVVEISLTKKEIKDSYIFATSGNPLNVNNVWADDANIYACTNNGLYMGKMDGITNLVNFAEWSLISGTAGLPSGKTTAVCGRDNQIFVATQNSIYLLRNGNWENYFDSPGWTTVAAFKGNNKLIFSQYLYAGSNISDQRIIVKEDNGSTAIAPASFFIQRPVQFSEADNGQLFYADVFRGLVAFDDINRQNAIIPNGPEGISCKEADFLNGKMWIGSSAIERNWNPAFTTPVIYASENYFWENFTSGNVSDFSGKIDFAVIRAIPAENKIFIGAHSSAFIEFNTKDNTTKVVSSLPNTSSPLRPTAAAMDNTGNLWIANAYSSSPLICRKSDGSYVTFNSTLMNGKLVNSIAVDDFNQVWVGVNEGGIVVLNYGASIDDKSDDRFTTFTSTPGAGGLPTNNVTALVNDLEGNIWVGTTQGAVYVPCPSGVFDRNCDAQQVCIPRNDGTNFCDLLLEDELVTCITVDAGNRKWIGTTNGLFLQSADGLKNIYYFNEQNSPLISNNIRNVSIHPGNGDLYISTAKGIITFRAEATAEYDKNAKAYAYPNPVRPEYEGPIAVKNLPDNADVKITDISGNLVFETTATGTQVVWDGKDVFGNRVSSGIYYVLAVSTDKKEKKVAKIAVVR